MIIMKSMLSDLIALEIQISQLRQVNYETN